MTIKHRVRSGQRGVVYPAHARVGMQWTWNSIHSAELFRMYLPVTSRAVNTTRLLVLKTKIVSLSMELAADSSVKFVS